jgi:diacylglycerol kinase family enzyme
MNLKVETDGKEIRGHFLLALVSNVHLYAGGLAYLSPNARLDDGRMDLWLFEGETLGDTVQHAWELWAGSHSESEQVQHQSFSRLRMEADSPAFIQIDGEPHNSNPVVSIEVRSSVLPVLIPDQTPHPMFSRQERTQESK